MSALVSILRAVHCRSTHHFFAIDALERLATPPGRRLATVLLSNYEEYLSGAKAPDTKFKDFQNHVIHVSDNHWGGAPAACEKWLKESIKDMHNEEWKKVAFDLGVLSHYFTDPLMPLHTAQHPSEAVVHRPLEWSVCKSYDWIYRNCPKTASFPLTTGPDWIRRAVLHAAELAHPHYHELVQRYDVKRGAVEPKAGLDARSREILATIFDQALAGWAAVLDRVAALAMVEIPIRPLTFTTVMAAVDVPSAWVVGRIADAAEQKAVKAIFEEFRTTGQVVHNVPPEIRAVAKAKPPSIAAETRKDEAVPQVQALTDRDQSVTDSPVQRVVLPENVLSPAVSERVLPERLVSETTGPVAGSAMVLPVVEQLSQSHQESAVESSRSSLGDPSPKVREVEPEDEANSGTALREPRVTLDSDLVDAPSIGPKTAAKFYAIGINTIGDFIAADPESMAEKLNTKWIDARTLVDWQDQAKLIVQVAALCGYKAQLLVGAEYRSANELAEAEVDLLHEAVSRYADTNAGARILRSAAKPSRDEIAKWIESAKSAQPLVHARAA